MNLSRVITDCRSGMITTVYVWWDFVSRLNSLRPRQKRRHFADDVFKCNFLNENVWIPIKVSLKFVPIGPINNIPALVQIMAWRRTGDKPLSEPIMTQFNDAYIRHVLGLTFLCSHHVLRRPLNSPNAGDGIFWLCGSIPCLMLWLLN